MQKSLLLLLNCVFYRNISISAANGGARFLPYYALNSSVWEEKKEEEPKWARETHPSPGRRRRAMHSRGFMIASIISRHTGLRSVAGKIGFIAPKRSNCSSCFRPISSHRLPPPPHNSNYSRKNIIIPFEQLLRSTRSLTWDKQEIFF